MQNAGRIVPPDAVDIDGGFWEKRQELNRAVTIFTVEKQFRDTGRFDAFKCEWKEGMPNKPHIFWDSDVAKWVESAAYILEKHADPRLEAAVEEIIDEIERNQDPSGYFNIWFTVGEPEMRFRRRSDHELYCAGHLIEAAVAYYGATGRDRFLNLMRKYADHIEEVFITRGTAAYRTPGHEEIELALYRLYTCTGEARYLNMCKWFLDNRANDVDPQYDWANPSHLQDHLPVREQETAEGHAVRAMYLYSAMADIAAECGDGGLKAACQKLFDNTVLRRMYVTGGIGSSRYGEAFTIDYDLPNAAAYAESCAAIGLAMFAQRMLRIDPSAKYSDVVERVLYNGFLSSTSLDGRAFFYENPLEINPVLYKKDASVKGREFNLPITERVEVFNCSCCPPNITRFVASLGGYLYTMDGETLYVHQYAGNHMRGAYRGAAFTARMETGYPHDGQIRLTVSGAAGMRAALRIPSWCGCWSMEMNGERAEPEMENGFAVVICPGDTAEILLDLEIVPFLVEATPLIEENSGRFALQKGPFIYCAEGADNGEALKALYLDKDLTVSERFDRELGLPVLDVKGWRKSAGAFAEPYRRYMGARDFEPAVVRMIPYYAFANRGFTQMLVWMNARRG